VTPARGKQIGRFAAVQVLLIAAASTAMVSLAVAGDKTNRDRSAPTGARATMGTPTFVQPGDFTAPPVAKGTAEVPQIAGPVDAEYEMAGHVLRRVGFGPKKKDVKNIRQNGVDAYLLEQLNPKSIDDSKARKKLPRVPRNPDNIDAHDMMRRWYLRMIWSKRQLREKMTLIWHEHFSVSNRKVGYGAFMLDHEELLRDHALGNFRDFLVAVTKDQAMLIWLDNNYNDGQNPDSPPNENYAREFLQLFFTGPVLLNIDGTPVLDGGGVPVPAYSEADILAVAKAMTGWYVKWPYARNNTQWAHWIHNTEDKVLMGQTITGRSGKEGRGETKDVVDIVLAQRADTVAAFISKILIQKLVTETPSPQFVSDVATVFRDSGWKIKKAVKTIVLHPQFTDPANMRTMYREPVEQFIGMVRALNGKSEGEALISWTEDARQLIYHPPSVFSFYPPGQRGALVSTATVFIRDRAHDEYVRGWWDTHFNPKKLKEKFGLDTPEKVVDWLAKRLLAANSSDAVRNELINYMEGKTNDTKFRGVAWLILCSPDFQRN
jgi:uncharacterized protein (DUF1800 family)